MTNAELLAKIKAEIKRRIEFHDSLASNAESEMIANLEIGAAQGLDDILPFLSNLESEKKIDGLEEEIKRYCDDWDGDCRYVQTARHFAQWQKEQMMKEAVEGEVTYDILGYNNAVRAGVINTDFKYGDKVRIIIVKED